MLTKPQINWHILQIRISIDIDCKRPHILYNSKQNWGRPGFDEDYEPQGACRDVQRIS